MLFQFPSTTHFSKRFFYRLHGADVRNRFIDWIEISYSFAQNVRREYSVNRGA
ncbi:hypothetical protein ABI_41000 [Asticcacaulis biprosthecium C19]|uniref:Uncharacterized protein n=1 Tax=Asticcacaulis biprosthecium C19 TaxID=715226 RepID=F4QSF7_9CAUL|nr:hypothetical protein ABI_41000 [Asticcacaulis biprosthecium C19]